jgi:hypothetical protein
MVIDLETKEGITHKCPHDAKFVCGVIYSYDDDHYYKYENPDELIEKLKKAKAIVSYNGELFDFEVLSKCGMDTDYDGRRTTPLKAKSYDILSTIICLRPHHENGNKFPSLNELMYSHFGVRKKKYDTNNIEEVLEHCLDDVKYTKMLYEEDTWKIPIKKMKRTRPKVHVCFKEIECRMTIPYMPEKLQIPCPTCDKLIMDIDDLESLAYSLLTKNKYYSGIPNIECPSCNTYVRRLVMLYYEHPEVSIITYGRQDCRTNPAECDPRNPDLLCKKKNKCYSSWTKRKYIEAHPFYAPETLQLHV